MAEDPRLRRLREIALALPEGAEERSGRHAAFRVRGRTFAYYLDEHRGDDGIVGVVFKSNQDEASAFVEAEPSRFYRPAYLGHRGWLGLRLDTGAVDWAEVDDFVRTSYADVAPKRLAREAASAPLTRGSKPAPAKSPTD